MLQANRFQFNNLFAPNIQRGRDAQIQSKIHKYRYRYTHAHAHAWPHHDAEQHVASFPSRKDNEIVFVQDPEQILWVLLHQQQNSSSFSGKLIIMQRKEKQNAKNIRSKILGKCNWICCCLRSHLKGLCKILRIARLIEILVQCCYSFSSCCCCSCWQQVELFMGSASIWSDYAPVTSCSNWPALFCCALWQVLEYVQLSIWYTLRGKRKSWTKNRIY